MFGLGYKDNAPVYAALIDISSGSVGVAIIASDAAQKLPVILYTYRSTMRIEKYTEHIDEDIRKVREAVLSGSLLLSQEGSQALRAYNPKARITELFVTISSPWSHTIAKTVEYKSDEEFKVTSAMIDDLIQSAEADIIAHLKGDTNITPDSFDIIERTTTNVTVNDYHVRNPVNLKGTILGLSHIAGLIAKEITGTLTEVQSKLFPNTASHAYTYILMMYFVLQELYPRIPSLCVINITGEATEIGIIEGGTLVETQHINRGSSTFVRDVMEQTGKPATDICTTIWNSDSETILHTPDFETHGATYATAMKEMLTEILGHRMIPLHVVITAHTPYQQFFTSIMQSVFREVLGKDLILITTPPTLLADVVQGTEPDTYLAFVARFFHKLQILSKSE